MVLLVHYSRNTTWVSLERCEKENAGEEKEGKKITASDPDNIDLPRGISLFRNPI